MGNRFGTFFIELAKNDMRQWMINLPHQDLAYLPQGARLRPPSDATIVQVRDGKVLISDGRFTETKEQIGGYCLLQAVSGSGYCLML